MSRADPNPDVPLREVARRAADAADARADAQATLDRGGMADIGDLSTGDLQLLQARRELQAALARMKHLEQAPRAAGRVLQPYLGGNGR